MQRLRTTGSTLINEYKYALEIAQMMFVFGEVQDPNVETVNLVEDIVRSQIIELIIQARGLTGKRGARLISGEDLIFVIRHDRGKLNRLKSYLSWKDVRKHAKENNTGGDAGATNADHIEEDKLTTKTQKITIKLPWEISSIYSVALKKGAEEPEEDEDDVEAHEAAIQRLREADEATRSMSQEEYQHYTECRQASFTWRKSNRFKEFLNLPPQFNLRNDGETIDIVGFLAYEMIRSLTISGLAIKRALENIYDIQDLDAAPTRPKRKKSTFAPAPESPSKRHRAETSILSDADQPPVSALFLPPPPQARTALRPEHIRDAFVRFQRDWPLHRSAGLRNFHGGLVRTNVGLI